MGLILPQTIRVRTHWTTCKHYREKGYEFEKCGDIIEVNVLDLLKRSDIKVKIICDICGKKSEMRYNRFVDYNEENKLITCGSNFCKHKKTEDTNLKKYGVKCSLQSQVVREKIENTNLGRYGSKSPLGSKEIQDKIKDTLKEKYGENIVNVSQVKEIQDKIKDTLKEKYGEDIVNIGQVQDVKDKIKATLKEKHGEGITCSFQLESVKEKSKQTMLNNYGVEHAAQSEIIQNKMKATLKKHYGVECSLQSQEIQDKIKATNLERYGAEHASQNEEIKNKILDSYQFNSTGPCSRQQKYIHFLIGGTLNKRICGSLADIYMEKENIIIEHDGSGHFLGDKINGNKTPSKESLLREKEREDKIINNGYKMIRFIATKDRIPSDEVILNLIEEFKNSDFKVVRIDFEKGTIEKDYKEKSRHNFGELRKITQKDLEKFEKQEKNISEN